MNKELKINRKARQLPGPVVYSTLLSTSSNTSYFTTTQCFCVHPMTTAVLNTIKPLNGKVAFIKYPHKSEDNYIFNF